MLAELEGDALLVPESPELGGFGHEIDGALYNTDTLKYFEVLIALERGAGARRDPHTGPGKSSCGRSVQDGAGFAYQFKRLFPGRHLRDRGTCPSSSCSPATYLMTLFPDASVRFRKDDDGVGRLGRCRLRVRARTRRSGDMRARRASTSPLNMVSFQEMTTAQVDGVRRPRRTRSGCPCLYSLNRDAVAATTAS